MVLFPLNHFIGDIHIAFLYTLFLFHFAFADSWTGASQPLEGLVTECSIPPAELPDGATRAQVIAEFAYSACREYRSSETKNIYYRIERVRDGEYIHLILAPGQTAIDPKDYSYGARSAYQTCVRIRAEVLAHALAPQLSRCALP